MKTPSPERDGPAEISPDQEKILWQKWLAHYLDRIPDASWPPQPAKLREFLDARMRGIFVEHPDALEAFLSIISDALLSSPRPQVIDALSEGLYLLRIRTFADYPSVESLFRAQTVERIGLSSLSPENVVGYKLEDDAGYVSIHIPPSLAVQNFIGDFRRAMTLLAERLEDDPHLRHAHTVLAQSLIVKNHPQILRRLGFTVSENDPQTATILVAEFKQKWLGKNT